MVTTTGKALGFIDYLLDLKGLKRRVAMTVNQFLVAPSIIRKSNMILTCSKRVAERFKLEKVKILPFFGQNGDFLGTILELTPL